LDRVFFFSEPFPNLPSASLDKLEIPLSLTSCKIVQDGHRHLLAVVLMFNLSCLLYRLDVGVPFHRVYPVFVFLPILHRYSFFSLNQQPRNSPLLLVPNIINRRRARLYCCDQCESPFLCSPVILFLCLGVLCLVPAKKFFSSVFCQELLSRPPGAHRPCYPTTLARS